MAYEFTRTKSELTITLTDDNAPDPVIITGANGATAFKALYDELAGRNQGDCSKAIAEGSIRAPGAAYPHAIHLSADPEAFWQACCDVMLADTQDYTIAS